jgi:flagellar biosynthesis GTPase FlhF
LLSHLLGLTVPRPPKDGNFDDEAVLLTGSGRSTACGLTVMGGPPGLLRLETESVNFKEMVQRYRSLTADLLRAAQAEGGADGAGGTRLKEEERRVLLTLAKLNKRRGEDGRWVDLTEQIVSEYRSKSEGLLPELLRLAGLIEGEGVEGKPPEIRDLPDTDEGRKELKLRQEHLSQGKGQFLPAHFTLQVPETRLGDWEGFKISFEDMPGIDEAISGRADIIQLLAQPATLLLICLPMGDVPGKAAVELLEFVKGYGGVFSDGQPTFGQSRILLAVLDHSQARQVVGADRDRHLGQELKEDECRRKLAEAGLPDFIRADQPVAVDASRKEDLERLRTSLLGLLRQQKEQAHEELERRCSAATMYLEQVDLEKQALTDKLYRRIEETRQQVREQHWPKDGPVRDPLDGLYPVLQQTHPGTIDATCRRFGVGERLNVYTVIEQWVRARAYVWLADLRRREGQAIQELLEGSRRDGLNINPVETYIVTGQWHSMWVTEFAKRVADQVRSALEPAAVWSLCEGEWGRRPNDPPYRSRIAEHLRQWSLQYGQVPALVETSMDHRPQPIPATRVDRLRVRQLRGIADLTLTLHPELTVLVGANGVGKTTILTALATALHPVLGILGAPGAGAAATPNDVRTIDGPDNTRQPQWPIHVEVGGQLLGVTVSDLSVTFPALEKDGVRRPLELDIAARDLMGAVNDWDQRKLALSPVLPVLVWYGEEPLNIGQASSQNLDASRQGAYNDALSASRELGTFLQWFRAWEQQRIQDKDSGGDGRAERLLAGVRSAVDTALGQMGGDDLSELGWEDLRWTFARDEATLRHPRFGRLALQRLSNGLRRVVAIVADLAHRCARLNPHLGEAAGLRTPGIVLIDEIDQHMHPGWQVRIIPALCKAFPLVQFIVTTHSPVVVAACLPEQVRILREVEGQPGHLVAEVVQEDPRMLTAAELLMDFFRLPRATPNPHGNDLREAAALAASEERNEFEEKRLGALLKALKEAGEDTSEIESRIWAPVQLEAEAGTNEEEP